MTLLKTELDPFEIFSSTESAFEKTRRLEKRSNGVDESEWREYLRGLSDAHHERMIAKVALCTSCR